MKKLPRGLYKRGEIYWTKVKSVSESTGRTSSPRLCASATIVGGAWRMAPRWCRASTRSPTRKCGGISCNTTRLPASVT
jgi:hypothetical protein